MSVRPSTASQPLESNGPAESSSRQYDTSNEILECWQKGADPAEAPVNFVFVLDYHLLPATQIGSRKPPGNLQWPMEEHRNANVYNFKYGTEAATSMRDLLNPVTLQNYADALVRLIGGTILQRSNDLTRIILVGYGYGGLICEQAALLARGKQTGPDSMYDGAICGLILLGTPHFRAGLAQWAVMCARANKNKEKNKGISVTAEEQNWSTYAEDITALTRIQSNFCEGFTGRNVGVKIVCCFADVSELSGRADLDISPEWCIPSGFRSTHIRSTYSEMTGFTRKVDYSGVEKLVTRWMKDVNGTEVDADAASIRSSRSFRGTAGDYISRRASVVKPVNWIHASHELNPSITVGAIVKDKDMELLATAAEIERFGVHRDSRKETTDFDEAPSPITGSQAFSIDHSQGFTNVTTEELNTMCARNYATGAVKLEKVREQLRNQKAGNTIYLVVGTKTAHGGNKHTSHPVTGLRAPTSASGSSKKSQADSPSAEDHQVQALQLRPLRVTSRNTASRGTLSPTTFAAPNF